MKISEQRIKAMVVMNIIDNCTMELDDSGREWYSLNETQFGELVGTLVKNIKVTQCCEGEDVQFYCTCSRAKGLDHDEEGTPYCISCQKEEKLTKKQYHDKRQNYEKPT